MVTGIGFGWPLLALFCQAMSWFTARRIGKPIWDYLGAHKVEVETLSPLRIVGLVVLFAAAWQLKMAVRGPHEEKILAEQFPEYKEYFERSGKWYLPVKE
jgi:protein-S-isoprenylcysteine O-methyltransferase Ste14